jgi:hypothetical protein
MTKAQPKPAVVLHNLGTMLECWIENPGAAPLRVWDRSNSWGWGTIQLAIAPKANPQDHFLLVPKSRIWTRNGPGFSELPPGGGILITLRPGDPEWEGLPPMDRLRDETLLVQGVLRIPPTPEARQFAVFVGEASSEPCVSEPPHAWLLANPIERDA